MKNLIIKVIVGLVIILFFILLANKFLPYTEDDIKRTLTIYLEKDKPNFLDYMRLDTNSDSVIDLADCVYIINEVNNEE